MIETVESIDRQLQSLDGELKAATDHETLKQQMNPQIDARELGHLEAEEQRITAELERLQELWYVMTLEKEIAVNTDLYEFETVFHSLAKLDSKIQQLEDNVKSKAMLEMSKLEEVAVQKLLECWNQLVVVTDNSITFNNEIHADGFPIEYESVLTTVEQFSLPQQQFQLSNVVFDCLVKPLFGNIALTLEQSTITWHELALESTPDAILSRHIASTRALCQFVGLIPNSSKIISYISPQLFDKLKQLITGYAMEISKSGHLQYEFNELGKFILDRGFKRSDLQQWISEELYLLVTEHSLNSHIDEIRSLFNDESSFKQVQHIKSSQSKDMTQDKETHRQASSADDADWNAWQEDDDINVNEDAWGNDGDVDPEVMDDDWDAWGDDGDDGDGAEQLKQPKPQKKLVSKLKNKKTPSGTPTPKVTPQLPLPQKQTSPEIITTAFPELITKIIKDYESTGKTLPQDYQQNHSGKVDYLLTAYYSLAMVKYPDLLLLYNDIKFLNFPSLNELGERLLLSFIQKYESSIVRNYEKLNGLDPSISSIATFAVINEIQYQLTEMFENVEILSSDIKTSLVLSIMDEFYQLAIDSIDNKLDIEEQESEYLSQIIQKFLNLEQPLSVQIKEYSKNYQKLEQLEFIMTNHMKEIMDKFYDGGFYELNTQEIVSMLNKLFADSELKRNNIREIKEMRDEQF